MHAWTTLCNRPTERVRDAAQRRDAAPKVRNRHVDGAPPVRSRYVEGAHGGWRRMGVSPGAAPGLHHSQFGPSRTNFTCKIGVKGSGQVDRMIGQARSGATWQRAHVVEEAGQHVLKRLPHHREEDGPTATAGDAAVPGRLQRPGTAALVRLLQAVTEIGRAVVKLLAALSAIPPQRHQKPGRQFGGEGGGKAF